MSTNPALPFYTTGIKAGFPSVAEDEAGKNLVLQEYLVPHPASTFFIRVIGDSMEGAGIFSDDLLIVDRSLEASHGKVVVAIYNGEFTVKRLIQTKNGCALKAENPKYPTIPISQEGDFQIWGVVTYVIHKP